ncbi:hypothetical protein T265_04059 [Opisthorchis viverrini]|uniref:Uncharacterized protein n=1 Tax=Opisthorchis viverrini TaxID=6198 RepID=A0A074ZU14_OPIVI|nr:hypothetical protein T265_04059 [Opisthorchis viverrini]KER29317.1 hypothetical protein T265_04059 [Opisthorchis viverrini]
MQALLNSLSKLYFTNRSHSEKLSIPIRYLQKVSLEPAPADSYASDGPVQQEDGSRYNVANARTGCISLKSFGDIRSTAIR